jgi:MtfA peptidase
VGLFTRSPSISDALWRRTVESLPIINRLTDEEIERLRHLAGNFVRRKQFMWTRDLTPDDAVRASVAAQACLPVLNLGLSWYSRWATILIVPEDYETDVTDVDEAGVVHEGTDLAAGEYAPSGLTVISLIDIAQSGQATGYNVVIHEAAHVIDARTGALDGAPPLHPGMDPRRWTDAFTAAYEDLQRRAISPGRRSRRKTALDLYAAEAPEEFFAVTSEMFFERPLRLRSEYPAVYEELAAFYRQNPAGAWGGS